ncbi:di-trans,poly-cis-decaprenylcistransferase [bacterium]|nr:di-trans,poly-cis-decaprenylcistransferase [bacterium]
MDGNGRWAKARGLPRAAGHREGVEALRRVVEACRELGVEHLTVFSFSTENWRRPPSEISALFDLLRLYVARDLARLRQEGVRIRIIGSREGLEPDLLRIIDECVTTTGHNTAFNLNIAFNYGGRAEIVEAVRAAARAVSRGEIAPDAIDESFLSACLWTRDLPDPDLLIRTSGEQRISNFLLWGCAYTEIVFMEERWPDFDRGCMERALDVFRSRQRRFGGVGA